MAFPSFILAMGITAALGNSVTNVVIAIAITHMPIYRRLIRGEMLRIREMEYAEAARTVGNRQRRIIFHPPAAQLLPAHHRPGHAGDGLRHPHRGGALLYRPRHPAAARASGGR